MKIFLVLLFSLIIKTLTQCPHTETGLQSWPYSTQSDVVIPTGAKILLDRQITLNSLTISAGAKLVVKPNIGEVRITSAYIIVYGSFIAGSSTCRYQGTLNIFLKDPTVVKSDIESTFGKKVLGVGSGGLLQLYGEQIGDSSSTKLTGTLEKDSMRLLVKVPLNWRVGQEILVAPTDKNQNEGETFIITSLDLVSVNLDRKALYRHNGKGGRGDERGEVSNLYRNIKIEGIMNGADTTTGGHIIFRYGVVGVYVSYVAFTKLGQQGSLGRYPLHFHAAGSVLGINLIEGNAIYRNNQRGIVVHGTNDVKVINNIVYDTFGHGFMLEDAVEENNVFEKNIGIFVKPLTKLPSEYHDSTPSVYWISNPRNNFTGNIAAGGDFGFWIDIPDASLGLYKNQVLDLKKKPLLAFRFNKAHSSSRCIFISTYTPKVNSAPAVASFDDSNVWKCDVGFWADGTGLQVRRITATNCGTSIDPAARTGNVVVVDATLIGRNSENIIETGEVVGIPFYAGWMAFKNVRCIDFYDLNEFARGSCLGQTVFHYAQPTNNYIESFSFTNSETMLFPRNGDASAQTVSFIDKTGSIAQPAGQFIVPSVPFMIDDNTCNCEFVFKFCACRSRFVRFEGDIANPIVFYRADRRKGDGMEVSRHADDRKIAVMTKKRYYLNFKLASPKVYSVDVWNGEAGDYINVGICYPPGTTFSITSTNFLNSKTPKTLVKQSSIKAVDDSDGYSYFFNESTGFLHLKMIFATTTPFGGSVRENYGPRIMINAVHSNTSPIDCISKITTIEPNTSPILPSVLIDRNGLQTKTRKITNEIQNTGAFYIALKTDNNIVIQGSKIENTQLKAVTRTNALSQQWTYEYSTGALKCLDGGLIVETSGGLYGSTSGTPIIMVKSSKQQWEYDTSQIFLRGSPGANTVFEIDTVTSLIKTGRVYSKLFTLIPVSGANVEDYESNDEGESLFY